MLAGMRQSWPKAPLGFRWLGGTLVGPEKHHIHARFLQAAHRFLRPQTALSWFGLSWGPCNKQFPADTTQGSLIVALELQMNGNSEKEEESFWYCANLATYVLRKSYTWESRGFADPEKIFSRLVSLRNSRTPTSVKVLAPRDMLFQLSSCMGGIITRPFEDTEFGEEFVIKHFCDDRHNRQGINMEGN